MSPVALHRAKFDLGSGIQIEIESALGRGNALSSLFPFQGLIAADEEVDPIQLDSTELPAMCWREVGDLFEPLQLREDTDYFVDIAIPMPIDEAIRRAAAHAVWPLNLRLASAFVREPIKRWREVEQGNRRQTIITGQLRLRSHAGVLDLGTEVGGALRFEVVCRKLQYFDEFKALIDSLAEKATELLLAYDSPVSLAFGLATEKANNDTALHFLMRYIMAPGQLPTAVADALADPHTRLTERLEYLPIDEIEEGQADLIVDHLELSSLAKGGPLARLFCGQSPRELPQRHVFESYDTPENRYAKALLLHCRALALRLEERMSLRKRRAAEREAKSWRLQLDDLCFSYNGVCGAK